MNKKYIKILIPTVVVILIGLTSFIVTYEKNKGFSKLPKHEVIKDKNIQQIFENMHQMANTKIVAVDGLIWGELQPTQNTIDELIKDVENTDYEDKDHLLEILNRWKKGDFSKCVDDHNYLWKKLGGEVGKASSLREGVK